MMDVAFNAKGEEGEEDGAGGGVGLREGAEDEEEVSRQYTTFHSEKGKRRKALHNGRLAISFNTVKCNHFLCVLLCVCTCVSVCVSVCLLQW